MKIITEEEIDQSKQGRKLEIIETKRKLRNSYVKYEYEDGKYPGDKN